MTRTRTTRRCERHASRGEIRMLYLDRGCRVRISRDGHVTFDDGMGWKEGRYVEEYYRDNEGNIVHA